MTKLPILASVVTVVLTCTPLFVAGQAQGAAITPEQRAFVSTAYEWLLVAHAQEEGTLTATLAEASKAVADLERVSARLSLERIEAEQALTKRTQEAEAARTAWERVRGPHGIVIISGQLNPREAAAEQEYTARLRAKAAAASRLQSLSAQRAEIARNLLAAGEARTAANRKLEATRQANQADRSAFADAHQAWVNSPVPTGELWSTLTQVITETAAENGAEATVTFKSSPQSGIVLYYQTIDDRKKGKPPRSINNPTQTTAPLPIGIYHIWHQQSGVVKSDRNREYEIVQKRMEVTVNLTP